MNLFDLTAKIVLDTGEYERGIKNAKYAAEDFTDSVDDMAGSIEGSDATLEDLADSLNESANAASSAGNEFEAAGNEANEAAGKQSKYSDEILNAIGNLQNVVGVAASIGAVGKAFEAINAMIDSAGAYGDKVDKESQQMGMSVQGYQKWDFILRHYGTTISGLGRPMKTLAKNARDGSEAFDALGLSTEKVAGMTNEQLFEATIAGLQEIADPVERAAAASELFGGQFDQFMALLNANPDAVDKLAEQWDHLNASMSIIDTQLAADYADTLQNFETATAATGRKIGSLFMPIKKVLMEDFTEAVAAVNGAIDGLLGNYTVTSKEDAIEHLNALYREYGAELKGVNDEMDAMKNGTATMEDLNAVMRSINTNGWGGEKASAGFERIKAEEEALLRVIQEYNDAEIAAENAKQEKLQEILDDRAQMYVSAYNTIRQNVAGYFGYFEESGGIAEMEDSDFSKLSDNLQSQIDYMTQYGNAITRLREYAERSDAPISGLIDYITSAGKEGAQVAVELQQAIDSGDTAKVDALAEKYAELQQTEDSLAGTITKAVAGYDALYEAANDDIEKIRGALNKLVESDYVVNILINDSVSGAFTADWSSAGGDPYVRQHNSLRLLHEGERVMTKRENEEYMNSQRGGNDADVQPINIVVQSVLDGDVIGETAYNYSYNKDRRWGT